MTRLTREQTIEWFAIVDELYASEGVLLEPQQLPRRFGVVVRAVDEVLADLDCDAVVAGGWAVGRYGYKGRISHDLDMVAPPARVGELIKVLTNRGFAIQSWERASRPKIAHIATDVILDIWLLDSHFERRPVASGVPARLQYVALASLVELKIAAGRLRDEADVIELIAANPERLQEIRTHLASVHADYATKFDALVARAKEDKTER